MVGKPACQHPIRLQHALCPLSLYLKKTLATTNNNRLWWPSNFWPLDPTVQKQPRCLSLAENMLRSRAYQLSPRATNLHQLHLNTLSERIERKKVWLIGWLSGNDNVFR